MPLLFSYGTLRDPVVQLSTFGRLINGLVDHLPGFRKEMISIADPVFAAAHGAIQATVRHTGDGNDRVEGMVLELTDAELQQSDRYEPAEYRRQRARTGNGADVWVYAAYPVADA